MVEVNKGAIMAAVEAIEGEAGEVVDGAEDEDEDHDKIPLPNFAPNTLHLLLDTDIDTQPSMNKRLVRNSVWFLTRSCDETRAPDILTVDSKSYFLTHYSLYPLRILEWASVSLKEGTSDGRK